MKHKKSASAKVVDGILILTLPDALRPVVWQMQLGQAKSSALEVRDAVDGTFLLILKTPRADNIEIAPFATKAEAVEALLCVSAAMEKAHGQLHAFASPSGYPSPALIPHRSWLGRVLKFWGYLLLALVTFFAVLAAVVWFTSSGERPIAGSASPVQQAAPAEPIENPASTPANEPVSAEDFLNEQ